MNTQQPNVGDKIWFRFGSSRLLHGRVAGLYDIGAGITAIKVFVKNDPDPFIISCRQISAAPKKPGRPINPQSARQIAIAIQARIIEAAKAGTSTEEKS